ncbi:dehydrogenase/reductase SDR family protein 7-like [Sitodiplosis mosellana]|uniref:dehydrogenase/reductase SDR family protein 7-like n=1 Tax=Sitodiplosis mosellana TaxID=263140 RepID=UPI0024442C62|nr:dehydrogenase/reductase SDR family protein 7-like [Sitodiplosis mosellana]
MFWLILLLMLLVILLILLYKRVRQDSRVKMAREEMPGKVVVITGANTVLGSNIAASFYGAGAKVVLVGTNQRELERVRTQLFAMRPKNVPVYQPEIVPMELNVSEMSAKEAVADIMETCGQVDILINNSTICPRSDVLSTSIHDDIRVMNVNYFSPIALTKAMLPGMIARKSGKIVFVSSVAGKVPIPYRSSFSASEHALQAFADTLRAEVAQHNVTVLVSSPEYIADDFERTDIESAELTNEKEEKSENTEVPVVADGVAKTVGDQPQKFSDDILLAVLGGADEHIKSSFLFSHWLRVTYPPFFHLMMAERAKKMEPTNVVQQRF